MYLAFVKAFFSKTVKSGKVIVTCFHPSIPPSVPPATHNTMVVQKELPNAVSGVLISTDTTARITKYAAPMKAPHRNFCFSILFPAKSPAVKVVAT